MSKTRNEKQEILTKLTEELKSAKAVVFADYKGMTMSQLTELRNKLSEQSAKFSVTKNTLLKLALGFSSSRKKSAGVLDNSVAKSKLTASEMSELSKKLEGPIATLFAYDDEITPIKTLVKALKDNNIGKVQAGILGSEFMDEYKVVKLSTLPSKDELRGKVVGVLAAPISGLQTVLFGNIRNLVYALDQVRKSKGGD